MPLTPLLVPHDDSKWSRAAAAYARLLAAPSGARTWLVHAISNPGFSLDITQSEVYGTLARQATAALAEEARHFHTPVDLSLLDGEAAEAIVAKAEQVGAGLIVMGTRGRAAWSGWMLGSTARGVLRTTDRPVLVVHEAPEAVRRIIVAVDESARAARVARVASELATLVGAEVVLVHVVDADRHLARHPEQYGVGTDAWEAGLAARRERVFGPLRTFFANPPRERLAFGPAVEGVREVAAEEQAEVVAVGRLGTSGRDLDAWLSVAFSLAIRGPFATLVV